MGTNSVKQPARLAGKLLAIRNSLGLSQNEMINSLECGNELTQSQISAFERGTRLPSLIILLKYSRLARVHLEVLVDDNLDLPVK